MSRSRDEDNTGRTRATRWLKNARVTASIATNVASPLAGPVAPPPDTGPPRSTPDLSQQRQLDAQEDWARHELVRRERSSSEVPPGPRAAKRERERDRR